MSEASAGAARSPIVFPHRRSLVGGRRIEEQLELDVVRVTEDKYRGAVELCATRDSECEVLESDSGFIEGFPRAVLMLREAEMVNIIDQLRCLALRLPGAICSPQTTR
jgi:hypothetical protein